MTQFTSYFWHFITVCSIACSTPGCMSDDRSEAVGIAHEANPGDIHGCPPWQCGTNGTVLAELQLDLDGQANTDGLSIVDFIDARGVHSKLGVENGQFVGFEPSTGNTLVRGADLIDGRITLQQRRGDGSIEEWALTVHKLDSESFMSSEDGSIPGYHLRYGPVSEPSRARSVCADGGPAVVVAGEKYDPDTLDVGQPGSSWFSLACRDQLLSKVKRMSYDPRHTPDDQYATTAAQRRATLGMLAADYCGDGRRFTTPGTPLYWQNRADWMVVGAEPPTDAPVEAGWNEHGAVCLDTPRHGATHSRADIEYACGRQIPACTQELLAASEWVTWLP